MSIIAVISSCLSCRLSLARGPPSSVWTEPCACSAFPPWPAPGRKPFIWHNTFLINDIFFRKEREFAWLCPSLNNCHENLNMQINRNRPIFGRKFDYTNRKLHRLSCLHFTWPFPRPTAVLLTVLRPLRVIIQRHLLARTPCNIGEFTPIPLTPSGSQILENTLYNYLHGSFRNFVLDIEISGLHDKAHANNWITTDTCHALYPFPSLKKVCHFNLAIALFY